MSATPMSILHGFSLGKSIVSDLWLGEVLKVAETDLSHMSRYKVFKSFKKRETDSLLSKQLVFRESVFSEYSEHWYVIRGNTKMWQDH